MSENVGISRQVFLTLATYMSVIVFHSSSLISAMAAALGVLLIQTAAFILFPFLCRWVNGKLFPFLSVIFTVIFAVLIYRLYDMIPLSGIISSTVLFPDPSIILITTPLLIDQANHPDEYRSRRFVTCGVVFVGMLLLVSFLREVLGFGSVFGKRVISEGSEPFLLLTHAAGAAFLLLILILAALFVYRQITGTNLVLAVTEDAIPYIRQPVLKKEEEFYHLETALMSLLFFVPALLSLYMVESYVLPSDFSFDLYLVVVVMAEILTAALLYLLFGKTRKSIQNLLQIPWFIPVQTMLLMLPYSLSAKGMINEGKMLDGLEGRLIYAASTFILTMCMLLFIRSIKRKLLFGNRPEILAGLPFLLLLAGLGLMILAGFGTIPSALMPY